MRLLVAGPRTGFPQARIDEVLDRYLSITAREDFVLIEGCADGVDTQAWGWAKRRGLKDQVLHYPAPWNHLGKPAGRWRNRAMLRVAKAERVVIFHPDIENGHGSRDMWLASLQAGLPTVVVNTA